MAFALIMKPPRDIKIVPNTDSSFNEEWVNDEFKDQAWFAATAGDEVTIESSVASPDGTDKVMQIIDADGTQAIGTAYYSLPNMEGKLKVELWFRATAVSADTDAFTWEFQFGDGTNTKTCKLKYDWDNDKWQYWNSAGALADISDGAQKLGLSQWHKLAFTLNLANDKYGYVKCDNQVMTGINGIAYQTAVAATNLQMVAVWTADSSSNNKGMYASYFKVINRAQSVVLS